MSRRTRRHWLPGDILRVVVVVLLFAVVAVVMDTPGVTEFFDIEHLRGALQGKGLRGNLAFVAIACAVTAVGIPRLWISVAAGSLYGAVEGSIMAQLASLVGAVLNFYFVRLMLRGPITRRMTPRMWHWYNRFNENGFRWLLYLRLFPLSNATVTNTIGGISRMRTRDFLAATFIGYLPLTIVFALFGSSVAKRDTLQLAIAGAIFLAVLVGRWAYEKHRRRGGSPDDGDTPIPGTVEAPDPGDDARTR